MTTERANTVRPSPETRLEIFRRMLRIERNDDATRRTIRRGRVRMPYYSARGQEAIPSAVSVNLNDDDTICTIYRGIHDMVAKGMPYRQIWSEIAGRVTGTCKGKGGPMHLTHPETGVMVTTGIVGSSMPVPSTSRSTVSSSLIAAPARFRPSSRNPRPACTNRRPAPIRADSAS